MRLLLFGLIPSVLAATLFKCYELENPSSRNAYLEIRNDRFETYLMIYKVIDYSELPNFSSRRLRVDNFAACVDEFKSEDVCNTIGGYVRKMEMANRVRVISSIIMQPGLVTIFNIGDAPGLFCVAGYQKRDKHVKGFCTIPHDILR